MDEKPHIVEKKSRLISLDPGVYYYCRCGKSADGMFCDGTHKGSSFIPKKFVIDLPQTVSICMCKHTEQSPFCDGMHKKI